MAWLIALGLFWWIGSAIAKGIDRVNYAAYKQRDSDKNDQEVFFANLYAIAWSYYQELEPQAFHAWEQAGEPSAPYHNAYAFQSFTEKAFGRNVEDQAVLLAWKALREAGNPVYVPNPDLKQASTRLGRGFVLYKGEAEPDVHELWHRTYHFGGFSAHPLYAFYDFNFAAKADAKLAFECMPEVDDPRVGYYFYQGRQYPRQNFPADYDEIIRRTKYPVQKRTYMFEVR